MGTVCCGKQEVIEAESQKSTSGSSHRNSSIILGRISKQQNYKKKIRIYSNVRKWCLWKSKIIHR